MATPGRSASATEPTILQTSTNTNAARHSTAGRRPTTPLRRISASSLRSLSLSHSRARPSTSTEPPLQHLGHVFAEMADAFADLSASFEALDQINSGLDGFNEAFGGYLYGLRVNSYCCDFENVPGKHNFDAAARRGPPPTFPVYSTDDVDSSDDEQDRDRSMGGGGGGGNETFKTHESEFSFMRSEAKQKANTASTRGRGGAAPRGRGRGRGGKMLVQSKKQKDESLAFADAIIKLLPIKFREQQPERTQTETAIGILRQHPHGLALADFASLTTVPTHRVNEVLTALVRAKVAIKKTVPGGGGEYRLDESKYPPSL